MITYQNREGVKQDFSSLSNLDELANFLQTSKKQLIYYSIILPEVNRYYIFTIPKKNGGEREIAAPVKTLKYIQRQLASKLQVLYEPSNVAHGFIQQYESLNKKIIKPTVITNADQHKRKNLVLNLDFKDFFPTITKKRVFGLFKNQYAINSRIAYYLTNICCTEKGLPQGAPTSPILTNMICSRLDRKLKRLSADNYVTYSRYADDLSFSTSRKAFPESFESEIRGIIENEGLFVNEKKRRLHIRENRMEVTGLTVNVKPNVQRKYVRNLRAIFHNIEKKGLDSVANNYLRIKNKSSLKSIELLKKYLNGKIEYLGQVKGKDDPVFTKFKHKYSEIFNPQIISKETQIETTDFTDKRDKLLVKYNYEIVASIEMNNDDQKNIKKRIEQKLDKARKILLSPDKNNYLETVFLLWFSCLNEFEKIHFKLIAKKTPNGKKEYDIFLDKQLIDKNSYNYEYLPTLPGYRNVGVLINKKNQIQSGSDKISYLIQLFLFEKRNKLLIYEFAWLNEIRNRLNLTHSDVINLKKSPYYERVSWTQCSWMFQFLYFIFTASNLKIDSIFRENKYINNHHKEVNMKISGIINNINKQEDTHYLLLDFSNNNSFYTQQIKIRVPKNVFKDYSAQNIIKGDSVRVVVMFSVFGDKGLNNVDLINIEKLSEPIFLAKYEKEN